ncbi:TPA: hypothetical protein RCG81_005132 [Enterobacter roggenkampii]|nr:hypothetical protein [Enterobacter roggenkampii]HDT2083856.1 hypothetical protein [Enterobacter roggenkampii]
MSHVKPADCTLIVISSQHLLAEQLISNLTDLLDIKNHLIRELFLNAFRKVRFKDLLRSEPIRFLFLLSNAKCSSSNPPATLCSTSSLTGGCLLPVVEQNSLF